MNGGVYSLSTLIATRFAFDGVHSSACVLVHWHLRFKPPLVKFGHLSLPQQFSCWTFGQSYIRRSPSLVRAADDKNLLVIIPLFPHSGKPHERNDSSLEYSRKSLHVSNYLCTVWKKMFGLQTDQTVFEFFFFERHIDR